MDIISIIVIAFALALDAFAVAVATGVCLGNVSGRQTFRLSFHFGLFQGLMNIGGWAVGLTFRELIENVDHWLAFALLSLIAINMIANTIKKEDDQKHKCDPTKGGTMVMLSVATSIDALAVGLTFSMLKVAIIFPALIIGLVAGLMTILGLHLGGMVGTNKSYGSKAELLGGLVLLGIAVNILFKHGVFSG